MEKIKTGYERRISKHHKYLTNHGLYEKVVPLVVRFVFVQVVHSTKVQKYVSEAILRVSLGTYEHV